jgi:hypothetical protein
MLKYSKTTRGFFCDEIHGKNVPPDCVEITNEQHANLMHEQAQGKEIVPDENGYPTAIFPSVIPATWEKVRKLRNALLKISDWAALPDAEPKPSKEAWLGYRKLLRDIPDQFTTPDAVVWPAAPTSAEIPAQDQTTTTN